MSRAPADLVGKRISWRPRTGNGGRGPAQLAVVTAYDADKRELTIEVRNPSQSMWSPACAHTRGPYWARARTQPGAGPAAVVPQQGQARIHSRYSVTCGRGGGGGMSKTWRR